LDLRGGTAAAALRTERRGGESEGEEWRERDWSGHLDSGKVYLVICTTRHVRGTCSALLAASPPS
jgi:hypothetical protein